MPRLVTAFRKASRRAISNGIANDAGGSRMLLYSNKAAMLMVTTSALAQIRNEKV